MMTITTTTTTNHCAQYRHVLDNDGKPDSLGMVSLRILFRFIRFLSLTTCEIDERYDRLTYTKTLCLVVSEHAS